MDLGAGETGERINGNEPAGLGEAENRSIDDIKTGYKVLDKTCVGPTGNL